MKLDKKTKDIIIFLVGNEIEYRDKHDLWLPYKDEEREDVERGIVTRRTALKAYHRLRRLFTWD